MLLEKKTTNKLQLHRDPVVVYSLFFSPTTYIYIYIYVITWSRVLLGKECSML